MVRVVLVSTLVALSVLLVSCASGNAAVEAEPTAPSQGEVQVKEAGPPPGIGKRDDSKVIGPYQEGAPLVVQSYKSSEANGTVNSWLLMGETDAALIDGQLVLSEGANVVEMIKASGKTLRWIWLTHGHPDHCVGLNKIVEAFPDARLLSHPRVAEFAVETFEKYKKPLNKFFPGDIPDKVVVPTAHEGDTLTLEGVTIEILTFEEGETEITTALHIPVMKALFAADMVYHRVHPWLNEMRLEGVRAHVDAIEAMDDVEHTYPGHGEPISKAYLATYRDYLAFFEAEVTTAKDSAALIKSVWAQHKDWRSLAGLRFSAAAYISARESAKADGAD